MLKKYIIAVGLFAVVAVNSFAQQRYRVSSPDGQIITEFWVSEEGEAHYRILRNGNVVLEASELGLIRRDMDFYENLRLEEASDITRIKEQYSLPKGKRLHRTYIANRRTYHLANDWGHLIDIIFEVSNDGVAFRYYFPGGTDELRMIVKEKTSFNFPESAIAWLGPLDNVKTGFGRSNPSYEMYYKKAISVGTVAPHEAGWAYPALFKLGKSWVLITETGLKENYAGTRLCPQSPDGEYRVCFPMWGETMAGGYLYPHAELPWETPWRVVTVGSLATIIESTHGTDLATPSVRGDYSFVKPGHASWSWAMLKDASVNYKTQKQFIDFAAKMGWEYTLVDVNWDTNIGYKRIAQLADYAKKKGVGLFLWYNSAGSWNTTPYHPRNQLLTHESRIKEFRRLHKMGIKGIKVDFFGGDGQAMIEYYQDLFRDAAQFELMVICHGSTLPRGWQRTYPNLMTMEAVKGFEYLTFTQENANHAASIAAMLPFTRNAYGPMDFTPMVFGDIPNINRITRNGLELAESVIFLSSIQNFAVTPQGMQTAPGYVKEFLRILPTVWQDTRFLTGYPGKHIILARKGKGRWYIAGLNGEEKMKSFTLDLSFMGADKKVVMITGGETKYSFVKRKISIPANGKVEIQLKGNGGFVMVPAQ